MLMPVHEISGVVPSTTVTDLLRVVGIDEGGINLDKGSNGFEAIRRTVKEIGRQGWSAGQILEQVSDSID